MKLPKVAKEDLESMTRYIMKDDQRKSEKLVVLSDTCIMSFMVNDVSHLEFYGPIELEG